MRVLVLATLLLVGVAGARAADAAAREQTAAARTAVLGTQRNASGVISRAPPGAAAVALDAAALASFADLQRALSRDADAAGGLNIYICMIGSGDLTLNLGTSLMASQSAPLALDPSISSLTINCAGDVRMTGEQQLPEGASFAQQAGVPWDSFGTAANTVTGGNGGNAAGGAGGNVCGTGNGGAGGGATGGTGGNANGAIGTSTVGSSGVDGAAAGGQRCVIGGLNDRTLTTQEFLAAMQSCCAPPVVPGN